MAKAIGVGGVFFRSKDPVKLGEWYKKWLEIPGDPPHGVTFAPGLMPEGGITVWSPFPSETDYFGPSGQAFMVNLIVDDLDEALAQVVRGGAELAGDVENYSYGRFGWFVDPDGNKVELWEPKQES